MWNRIGLCAGCASLAVLTGCSSLPERVARLEEENAQIRQELAAMQGGDTVKLNELFEIYWDGNYNRISPVLMNRYLGQIELPADPSPKDIDAYLMKLYSLRRYNFDGNMNDQVTAKVSQVGAENLTKLIPYLEFNPFSQAFIGLGGGEQKELLKRALLQKKNSSQIASLYVSVAEASDGDFILEMLPQIPALIDAVAKLRLEEKALPILKQRLADSAFNRFNYDQRWLEVALNAMKPEERQAFVDTYWSKFQRSRSRQGNDWELRERAAQIAPFGCVPAFQYMVDAALRQDTNNYLQRAMALTPCLALDEFAAWYKANRDKLAFDRKDGVYKPAE